MKDSDKGHRKRLRERLLQSGISGFHDYEVVELLLTLGTPMKDCKQQAKEAIKKFGSLREVISAPAEELQKIKGIGEHNVFGIKLAREVAERFLKEKVKANKFCRSSQDVFDYLYHTMRDLKKEVFSIIFLNSKNCIIDIEQVFEGTLNASAIYPREVIKSAIRHNACSIICIHNHPSGNTEPSPSDREITKNLILACTPVEIKVLDHIIIGDNNYFSFADNSLIEKYIKEEK